MIELTKEQALTILKNLSAIEGFLWAVKIPGKTAIFESYVDPVVDLLTDKLEQE